MNCFHCIRRCRFCLCVLSIIGNKIYGIENWELAERTSVESELKQQKQRNASTQAPTQQPKCVRNTHIGIISDIFQCYCVCMCISTGYRRNGTGLLKVTNLSLPLSLHNFSTSRMRWKRMQWKCWENRKGNNITFDSYWESAGGREMFWVLKKIDWMRNNARKVDLHINTKRNTLSSNKHWSVWLWVLWPMNDLSCAHPNRWAPYFQSRFYPRMVIIHYIRSIYSIHLRSEMVNSPIFWQ